MTRKKLKVEGHSELEVIAPGVVANTDRRAFVAYVVNRKKVEDRDKEVADLKEMVKTLAATVEEMKAKK